MHRRRNAHARWALFACAFASTVARSSNAKAQHFASQFSLTRGAVAGPPATATRGETPAPHANRERLLRVEHDASGGARRVLAAARAMVERAVVIRGTCATWLEAVYRRAGGRSSTVFTAQRGGGYADRSLLRPGDWVRFVNHSFHGVGHSAIFIGWADAKRSFALTLSHPGQYRASRGRFHAYDFRHVYQIDRMQD